MLTFKEAIEDSKSKNRVLLLGNGFSSAWDKNVFSYSALLDKAKNLSPSIQNVFNQLKTVDFEEVIRAFDYYAIVCDANGFPNSFKNEANQVRDILISTISENHPDNPSLISNEQFNSCVCYLKNFNSIYTLNYDMLLYWVLMRDMFRENKENQVLKKLTDGFAYNNEQFLNWDGVKIEVNYLHGALHLFEHSELEKLNFKRTGTSLKSQFIDLIKNKNKMPLFVAGGSSEQKIKKIRKSGYLTRCLNSFQKIGSSESSIFSFGVSFSDKDNHIINCIAKNKVGTLYVGLYGDENSPNNKNTKDQVQKIQLQRKTKPITIKYYDTSSSNPWK